MPKNPTFIISMAMGVMSGLPSTVPSSTAPALATATIITPHALAATSKSTPPGIERWSVLKTLNEMVPDGKRESL
jgi:hypothetical protein